MSNNNDELIREIYADVQVIKSRLEYLSCSKNEERLRKLENRENFRLGIVATVSAGVTFLLRFFGIG